MAEGSSQEYDSMQVEEGGLLSSSDETADTTDPRQSSQRGRKRVRNPDKWKKKHVKRKGLRQNAPQVNIHEIAKKNCCKKACVQQVTAAHLASLRQHFSTLTYEEQNLYLTGLMVRKETKKSVGHKRKSNPTVGKNGRKVGRPPAEESSFSVEYQICNESGLNQKVCQRAFFLIHGFGKKRLQVLRKKMPVGSVIPERDRRGKHDNWPQRISNELHQKVREHMSFPVQQSRHDNSGRLYLAADLSITRMYYLFIEKYDPDYVACMEQQREALVNHQQTEDVRKPIISEHYYHDIFVSEFNLHFGCPRSDTCDTCDSLKIQIEAAEKTGSEQEKVKLEKQLEDHLKIADEGYASLRKDCERCKESWSDVTNADPCERI